MPSHWMAEKSALIEKAEGESLLDVASEIRMKVEEINQKLDYLIQNYRKTFCSQHDSYTAGNDSECDYGGAP